MVTRHHREFASPTGAVLSQTVTLAEGKPVGVIQINHGMAEHSARYDRFADALAGAGFHVYAHDHRGHGHTRAADAVPGRFAANDGVEKVLTDIDAVHDQIVRKHPDLPLIIFGHSMGGIVTLNSVLRRSKHLAGAAVWNANFSPGLLGRVGQAILAWEKFRLGSDVPSRILPKLTFQDWAKKIPNHRTSADWLSRDPVEVDKYVTDPLCGWDASVSMWQDVFKMVFAGADDRSFASVRRNLPFNLAGGGADPSTVNGKAVEKLAARMRKMGFSNLVSKVWPETRHESLNDINRDEITADFSGWAKRVVSECSARQPRQRTNAPH
ncbi:alpha/beta fold hydrolase [Mesorhizobium sp. IMUNJ 23232]|uniref:alpha/beta fold hydrolase n=1 Tax=Mesorhizobium sp. IMUNJ 23232 TaxID=3376064 RepID=UPI0037ADEA03